MAADRSGCFDILRDGRVVEGGVHPLRKSHQKRRRQFQGPTACVDLRGMFDPARTLPAIETTSRFEKPVVLRFCFFEIRSAVETRNYFSIFPVAEIERWRITSTVLGGTAALCASSKCGGRHFFCHDAGVVSCRRSETLSEDQS
jgi:hypothetical protein